MRRIVPLLLAVMLFTCALPAASAAQVDADKFHEDFNQAMDDLDEMELPDIEEITGKLDDLLNIDGLSQAASALRVFLENHYFGRVFLTAFMLSLISYIFFGKR